MTVFPQYSQLRVQIFSWDAKYVQSSTVICIQYPIMQNLSHLSYLCNFELFPPVFLRSYDLCLLSWCRDIPQSTHTNNFLDVYLTNADPWICSMDASFHQINKEHFLLDLCFFGGGHIKILSWKVFLAITAGPLCFHFSSVFFGFSFFANIDNWFEHTLSKSLSILCPLPFVNQKSIWTNYAWISFHYFMDFVNMFIHTRSSFDPRATYVLN